ncbi:MAG: glycerophosphodiester phosphodiesterase family protein [Tenacibaculum sp.]
MEYCIKRQVNALLTGAFAFIGIFCTLAQTKVDSVYQYLKNPTKNYVLVVSHRGDWRYAPENSLQAIQRCIELGVDIVELDVRKTKDGHLVLLHDKTLNRTTNGKGKVSELNLAEIKKLRLKNAINIKGSQQAVPTLREALSLTKDKIMVNLDKIEADMIPEIFTILQETKTLKQVILKGRLAVDKMIKKNGSLMQKIIYMPIISTELKNPNQFIINYEKNLKPLAYELLFSSINSENFKQITYLNKQKRTVLVVALWDELCGGYTDEKMLLEGAEASWGKLISFGVNALMTDRPKSLIKYLKSKGLR